MSYHKLHAPNTDPTPIIDAYRAVYASQMLTASVAHLGVFETLAAKPLTAGEFRTALGLEERPFVVLATMLRALGLLTVDASDCFDLTETSREHLVPGGRVDISGYIGLEADSPGVVDLVERLRTNRPAGTEDEGAAYIYQEGEASPMDREESARFLTLALAGRAKNVAPILAANHPLNHAKTLLDVGGGTGIYSIAYLEANPDLRAIVWDRPEVLKIAAELAEEHGVSDRIELKPGDMFADPVPTGADVILLSNILHDWDVPECRTLVNRLLAGPPARRLAPDPRRLPRRRPRRPARRRPLLGRPLPMTEGRAYSAGEYRGMAPEAGLTPGEVVPTLVHCGVLPATREGSDRQLVWPSGRGIG